MQEFLCLEENLPAVIPRIDFDMQDAAGLEKQFFLVRELHALHEVPKHIVLFRHDAIFLLHERHFLHSCPTAQRETESAVRTPTDDFS